MLLSVIIPTYNEKKTIKKIVKKIKNLKYIKTQIIVVDDFSTDGTREIIRSFKKNYIDKAIFHDYNQGKGAAINSAKKFIKGDIVIIQDADLEYNPKEYKKLILPIIKKKYKVVYGSRVLRKNRYKIKTFTSIYRIFFNHILTVLSNIINSQNLTDAHTCYKIFDVKIFKKIQLKEKRFGFCPEITTKISKMNLSIFEVPISYNGRSYKDGKKISIFDGIRAIYCLIIYRFIN